MFTMMSKIKISTLEVYIYIYIKYINILLVGKSGGKNINPCEHTILNAKVIFISQYLYWDCTFIVKPLSCCLMEILYVLRPVYRLRIYPVQFSCA